MRLGASNHFEGLEEEEYKSDQMSSTSSEDSDTDTSDSEDDKTNPNQDSGSMQPHEIYNPANDDQSCLTQ